MVLNNIEWHWLSLSTIVLACCSSKSPFLAVPSVCHHLEFNFATFSSFLFMIDLGKTRGKRKELLVHAKGVKMIYLLLLVGFLGQCRRKYSNWFGMVNWALFTSFNDSCTLQWWNKTAITFNTQWHSNMHTKAGRFQPLAGTQSDLDLL